MEKRIHEGTNDFTIMIPRKLWGRTNEIGFVIHTKQNPELDSLTIERFYIEAVI